MKGEVDRLDLPVGAVQYLCGLMSKLLCMLICGIFNFQRYQSMHLLFEQNLLDSQRLKDAPLKWGDSLAWSFVVCV